MTDVFCYMLGFGATSAKFKTALTEGCLNFFL